MGTVLTNTKGFILCWFSPDTYIRHPLYTFSGDSGPGQAGGNGISAFGGAWHAVTTSGTVAPASSPSSSGGGHGY